MKWKIVPKMASHNPPIPTHPLYFLSRSVKRPAFISEPEFPTAAQSLTTTQQTSVFLPLPSPHKTHKQTFELHPFNKTYRLSRVLPQALSTFDQFFGSPPHGIGWSTRHHKKFTGRLHAPDHTACIMHSRSWRNPRFHSIYAPSRILRRNLIHSSPRRFLHPLTVTWQLLLEKPVFSLLLDPPIMIPLTLFKLPLLSQWTQLSSSLLPSTLPAVRGENVDSWYCCIMKSFQHGARPPSELNLQFCFFSLFCSLSEPQSFISSLFPSLTISICLCHSLLSASFVPLYFSCLLFISIYSSA